MSSDSNMPSSSDVGSSFRRYGGDWSDGEPGDTEDPQSRAESYRGPAAAYMDSANESLLLLLGAVRLYARSQQDDKTFNGIVKAITALEAETVKDNYTKAALDASVKLLKLLEPVCRRSKRSMFSNLSLRKFPEEWSTHAKNIHAALSEASAAQQSASEASGINQSGAEPGAEPGAESGAESAADTLSISGTTVYGSDVEQ
ncbi:hypothetical protein L204_104754 [Cryptococcus depauperatus]|nr:hypothetical protein L204_05252 [Cryptococcus depauperatus CBS 7855]